MGKKNNKKYIFDATYKDASIDIKKVADIESRLNNGITVEDAELLLDFVVSETRAIIAKNAKVSNISHLAQYVSYLLLKKMRLTVYPFNIKNALECSKIDHTVLSVKILINGMSYNTYIVDPTFRRFCLEENCRVECFNKEEKLTPDPGYFLNMTDKGRVLANYLIINGYFLLNEENAKTYGDSFCLSGRISDNLIVTAETDITSYYYLINLGNHKEEVMMFSDIKDDIRTPLEKMNNKSDGFLKSLLNRISLFKRR
ncbi:MAG: hypothetical protein PHD10_04500 [Bacilli bacterium]|nr:hypothetical protein [Bacilli bacterium]MDD4608369.1 hypothetical protein [Bacilli bacterium]